MIEARVIPEGFVVERNGGGILVVVGTLRDAAVQAGLDRPEAWSARVAGPAGGAGRSATAVIDLAGCPARIKALSRGGLLRPLWHGRFWGCRRLWSNLAVPLEARRRGVATPRPLALALAEGPRGFFRGWLATEEIPGGIDLARAWRSAEPPADEEVAVVMARVREMHDRGVDHRDLNLGNLLFRRGSGEAEGFILDLDRARLHESPLPVGPRARALARLERSAIKIARRTARTAELSRVTELLWSRYAAGDVALGRRLSRSRRLRSVGIAVHRLGGLR